MRPLALVLLTACAAPPADRIELGEAVLFVARDCAPDAAGSVPLVVHFQGGVAAVAAEWRNSGAPGALLVSTLRGRSGAFAGPYRDDPTRFAREIAAVEAELAARLRCPVRAAPLTVSFFSAGYGAVRELLRDAAWEQRIATLIALDSIHADRARIDEQMAGFVRFARAATRGDKRFLLVHSAIRTEYASTTECADHLLAALGLERHATPRAVAGTALASEARAGGFEVLAIPGGDAAAHVACFRFLAFFLRAMRAAPARDDP